MNSIQLYFPFYSHLAIEKDYEQRRQAEVDKAIAEALLEILSETNEVLRAKNNRVTYKEAGLVTPSTIVIKQTSLLDERI